ncbi:MAG: hypothetical protein AAB113_08365 [Candidatus Eisenbacteria bacterium]
MINPPFEEPLAPDVAQRLARHILHTGGAFVSRHARERMRRDQIEPTDWGHVLRAGWVMQGEWEHGSWRYQVRTQHVTVVVTFRSLAELVIVTAWRNRA